MKNNFKLIFLLIIGLFVFSGCDAIYSGTTRDIRHAGYNVTGNDLICPNLIPDNGTPVKIKYLFANSAVTEDGTIYKLSYSQYFSNNYNCMMADFPQQVAAVFDDTAIRGTDGRIYYYLQSGDYAPLTFVTQQDENYGVYNLLLGDRSNLKIKTVDSNSGSYYILKNDGNVYNYIVDTTNKNAPRVLASTVVYGKQNFGGNIIDFNHEGNSKRTFVRTEGKIFRMVPTNEEKCTKYADIECDYRMQEDENLTKRLDKILGYSGSFVITTYGKEFAG